MRLQLKELAAASPFLMSVCLCLVGQVDHISFCKIIFGNCCRRSSITFVSCISLPDLEMSYVNLGATPFAACLTMFAATSVRDNSLALVMGSCLLGGDGGNCWEQECAWLARLGQRRKWRCVFACVFACVCLRLCACDCPNLCWLSYRKKTWNVIWISSPFFHESTWKKTMKGAHLGSLSDNTGQCPWWQPNWGRKWPCSDQHNSGTFWKRFMYTFSRKVCVQCVCVRGVCLCAWCVSVCVVCVCVRGMSLCARCVSVSGVSGMLTLFSVRAWQSVMCWMCELEPCLACQSDEEIIRGVTLKSLISLISCRTNNASFYMRPCPAANCEFISLSCVHTGI